MEFSREVYHLIVRHVGTRSDLIALSTVSKRFQQEAERSLYNTLHLRGHSRIMRVCHLLSSTPRLSVLVEALSIFVAEDASDDDSEEEDEPYESAPIPDGFWQAVAAAFRAVDKLRFLSVYFEQTADTAHAWVLNDCRFQLRTFHCDFEWDQHMAGFLRAQHEISDLCLADFRKDVKLSRPPAPTGALPLPKLSILECTFSEAAMCLVPGRPVVRVKTCFSRTAGEAKTAELGELLGRLKQSRRALRALDLADEAYTEDFSLELLAALGGAFARFADLRYLGTLVLPVDGKKARRALALVPVAPV